MRDVKWFKTTKAMQDDLRAGKEASKTEFEVKEVSEETIEEKTKVAAKGKGKKDGEGK